MEYERSTRLLFTAGFLSGIIRSDMSSFEVVRDPIAALQQYFGFSSFRKGQDAVIKSILDGRDSLVVMPTGGGKSLCYQLPALCREGLTLVVSPLIALMKDQVDALVAKGIPATMINSSLSQSEQWERIQSMRRGDWKLVYIAPERFGQPGFVRALKEMDVSLVAIDEAHCLSQWGHDFRPDYLRLGRMLDEIGRPQTVALTATATPKVRQDILAHLHLDNPELTVRGFSRENLHFRISHCDKQKDKFRRINDTVQKHKTGIIYCSTRKRVESVYQELRMTGINAVAYHAGMSDEEREKAQNDFISCKADVAVATNAFGMGIDRADVRFVIHFEIPGSVEAYYQEAGRAGRDGMDAWCELLFNHADLRTQEFFIEGTNPGAAFVVDLYEMLRKYTDPDSHELVWTVQEMTEKLGKKNEMAVSSALAILTKSQCIERFDIPGKRAKGTRITDPSLSGLQIPLDEEGLKEKERRDREKLSQVTRFAYSEGCRQMWILDYFGEGNSTPCGKCDTCEAHGAALPEPLGEEETLIVRKALSGIARASRRLPDGGWEGIFGRNKIIAMLRGSKSKDLQNTSLPQQKSYGILKDLSEQALTKLFRAMQESGLTCNSGGEWPLITLSAKGYQIMMGNEDALMIWPLRESNVRTPLQKSSKAKQETTLGSFSQFDENLFVALKELRKELADDEGVPPFFIFSNAVLEAFARIRPTTRERAEEIHGVGPAKARKYLAAFLDLIADYEMDE